MPDYLLFQQDREDPEAFRFRGIIPADDGPDAALRRHGEQVTEFVREGSPDQFLVVSERYANFLRRGIRVEPIVTITEFHTDEFVAGLPQAEPVEGDATGQTVEGTFEMPPEDDTPVEAFATEEQQRAAEANA